MKKKVTKRSSPSWHPNFRQVESLPDIKIIRTDFLVNSAGILIPLILIGMLVYSHLQESNLQSRVNDLETMVAQKQPLNNRYIKQNREFNAVAKQLNEISGFLEQQFDPIELLLDLIEMRPEFIAYRSIRINEQVRQVGKKDTEHVTQVALSGSVRGSSAEELRQMDAFQEMIRTHEQLAPYLADLQTSVQRNMAADVFDFNMTILLKND